MFKKIIILFFVSLLVILASYVFAQKSLYIENSSAMPGGIVYIPLKLTDGTDIAGMNLSMNFYPAVLENITFLPGNLLNGHIIAYNSVSPNEFRLVIYSKPTIAFEPGAGTIGYIQAEISPSALPGTEVAINFLEAVIGTTAGVRMSDITTNDGILTLTPTKYSFESGAEGWQFTDRIPPYDAPATAVTMGVIALSPQGSTNCFAYWYSPDLRIENDNLYRIRWLIGSTVDNPDACVQFRLRVNQRGAWASWDRVVNSYLGQAPSLDDLKEYFVFFDPRITGLNEDNKVIFSFDIISFDIFDDANSWLFVEELMVEKVFATIGNHVFRYDFNSNNEGWTFAGNIPPFDPPASIVAPGRLGMNPDGSVNCFSYWFSPDVTIQKGKIYRLRWEVESSATNPDEAVQFRVRTNQRGSWSAWNRVINSYLQNAPSWGNPKLYDVIIDPVVTRTSEDDKLIFSFDILSFDWNDDRYSWNLLNSVSLDEILITP
ncbi:MAG: cohesin domain-containing protein [Candidatus Sumerlaeia bacterium]|nr:cohesin domain-containing protein [Candidatus Sumerlaeia bacterium]